MTVLTYHPEMKEAKPKADGELRNSFTGGYIITTPLELPTSRGVKHEKTYKSTDLNKYGQHKVGWNVYRVTKKGLQSLEDKGYTFSFELLLD